MVANTTGDVNIFAGSLGIIVEPRLDDDNATAYYVTADPAQVDMLVYGYLEGEAGPTVTTVDERDLMAPPSWPASTSMLRPESPGLLQVHRRLIWEEPNHEKLRSERCEPHRHLPPLLLWRHHCGGRLGRRCRDRHRRRQRRHRNRRRLRVRPCSGSTLAVGDVGYVNSSGKITNTTTNNDAVGLVVAATSAKVELKIYGRKLA